MNKKIYIFMNIYEYNKKTYYVHRYKKGINMHKHIYKNFHPEFLFLPVFFSTFIPQNK